MTDLMKHIVGLTSHAVRKIYPWDGRLREKNIW